MNLGRKLLSVLVLAASVAACGGEQARPAAAGSRAQEGRRVELVAVARRDLPKAISVTGTLSGDEQVLMAFKVAGRVQEVAVDLGSRVREGQVLARLDPTDFRLRAEQAHAALQQARAQLGLEPDGTDERVDPEATSWVREARAVLDEARLHRDRMARLLEQEYVAKAEFDSAEARLLVAEGRHRAALDEVHNRRSLLAGRRSELALARQQLADSVLYAPLDGAVQERRISPGEFLAAGQPAVAIVRTHPLRFRVSVPEREAPALRVGQRVTVRVEGEAAEHRGTIARLSPALQEQNRTLIVEAEIANPSGRLRPGAFARGEIVVEAGREALLVPATAVVSFAGLEKVLGVREGRAVERRIRTGRRAGAEIEVLEGLTAGELVVAEPGNLAGGQPVVAAR